MSYPSPPTPLSLHNQNREHVIVPVSANPPPSPAPSTIQLVEVDAVEKSRPLPSYLWDLLLATFIAILTLTPFIALVLTTPLALNDIRNSDLYDAEGVKTGPRMKAEAARWMIILCWYGTGFYFIRFLARHIHLWLEFIVRRTHGVVPEKLKAALDWYVTIIRVLFPRMYQFSYQLIIFNILMGVSITIGLFTLQRIVLQMIAVRFHRLAYNDRVKKLMQQSSVIETLEAATAYLKYREPRNETHFFRNFRRRPSVTIDSPNSGTTPSSSPSTSANNTRPSSARSKLLPDSSTTEIMENLLATAQDDKRTAAKRAYKMFKYIKPIDDAIRPKDLEFFYERDNAARATKGGWQEALRQAFRVLDPSGSGKVTMSELADLISDLQEERENLANSRRDFGQAVGKLDTIFTFVNCFVLLFIWTVIFTGADSVMNRAVSFGSVLLAMSFVFGNAARNMFEGVIFHFLQHPFDVGDRVIINAVGYKVLEMGLLTTTLMRGDNQTIYAPNSQLSTMFINNIRRSPPLEEGIEMDIAIATTREKIDALRARLQAFCVSSPHFLSNGMSLTISSIANAHQLRLMINICYAHNWQETSYKVKARSEFMLTLKEALGDLKITFEFPKNYPNGPKGWWW